MLYHVQKYPKGYLGPTAYSPRFLEQQGKLDMGFLDPCNGYYKYTDDVQICEDSHNLRISHKIGCHPPTTTAIRLDVDILRDIYLQYHFLLERFPVSCTNSNGQRLFDVAIEALDDVLMLWVK